MNAPSRPISKGPSGDITPHECWNVKSNVNTFLEETRIKACQYESWLSVIPDYSFSELCSRVGETSAFSSSVWTAVFHDPSYHTWMFLTDFSFSQFCILKVWSDWDLKLEIDVGLWCLQPPSSLILSGILSPAGADEALLKPVRISCERTSQLNSCFNTCFGADTLSEHFQHIHLPWRDSVRLHTIRRLFRSCELKFAHFLGVYFGASLSSNSGLVGLTFCCQANFNW